METYYWTTEEPHKDNNETMQAYIIETNMLDIIMVDGTYAEGVNCKGERFGMHASGDGDAFNHKIEFELLEDGPCKLPAHPELDVLEEWVHKDETQCEAEPQKFCKGCNELQHDKEICDCGYKYEVREEETGTTCSVCNEPQFESPCGITCRNGHGGAPSKEDE